MSKQELVENIPWEKEEENYGVVTDVYGIRHDGRPIGIKVKFLKPSIGLGPGVSESFSDVDYSRFKEGQEVVHVRYTRERPMSEDEKKYFGRNEKETITDFRYVTYDAREYEQMHQLQEAKKQR